MTWFVYLLSAPDSFNESGVWRADVSAAQVFGRIRLIVSKEMNEMDFMEAIGFDRASALRLREISVSEKELFSLPESDLLDGRYLGPSPDRVLALITEYLRRFSEENYLSRGVTHTEWLHTVGDVVLWKDALFVETGEFGVRETHWLSHLVRTEIFRLGRLQFIPRVSERAVRFREYFFPAGTKFCEVHIPKGEKLFKEETERSFCRAQELFSPAYYGCSSWLLSPKLKNFLGGGNILSFQQKFECVSFDGNDRSAERYIFGKILDPHDYEPANAFSARVREAAVHGDYIGAGLGYCVIDTIYPNRK